jgi:hypothetical protein
MGMDEAVRALVAPEVRRMLAQCDLIRASIDHAEAALPIMLDKRERDAARVDAIMRRARLECVLAELRGVEDRVVHLARERWPQWRT